MPIHHPDVLNDPERQWRSLLERSPEACRTELEAAFALASEVHAGQTRRSADGRGEIPYVVHPLRVARILMEEWGRKDCRMFAAALLHDVLEDTPLDARDGVEGEMRIAVGDEVADAVGDLSKPQLPEPAPPDVKATREARYFAVLRSAPRWVRLVKCADRLDNLRDAIALGSVSFWNRYSSETIGWHLYLARETAPIAEVALFKELVRGARELRGRVPVWADGYLIDPVAAALIPEHVARAHGVIGLALRGDTLLTGMRDPDAAAARVAAHLASGKAVEPVPISPEAFDDALRCGLYGAMEN